jgi:hypothetical protein
VDSTLQHRASLHPENTKTFNHGQGFVVGHQWTNIVVLLNDLLHYQTLFQGGCFSLNLLNL